MERNQIPYFPKNCTIQCTKYTILPLDNGDTITNPYDIANTFNNYFVSIAEIAKRSIKYSHKHFSDYLSNESNSRGQNNTHSSIMTECICRLIIHKFS